MLTNYLSKQCVMISTKKISWHHSIEHLLGIIKIYQHSPKGCDDIHWYLLCFSSICIYKDVPKLTDCQDLTANTFWVKHYVEHVVRTIGLHRRKRKRHEKERKLEKEEATVGCNSTLFSLFLIWVKDKSTNKHTWG